MVLVSHRRAGHFQAKSSHFSLFCITGWDVAICTEQGHAERTAVVLQTVISLVVNCNPCVPRRSNDEKHARPAISPS